MPIPFTPRSSSPLQPGKPGSLPSPVAALPPGQSGSLRSRRVKPQGYRCDQHDYWEPCFYMITITTKDRAPILSTCDNGLSHYTEVGQMVLAHWRKLSEMFPQVETSTLMLMPDHLHGIIRVKERMKQPLGVPIRAFKSLVTSALRKRCANPGFQPWNPGFHDLIVLRRGALDAYSAYIRDNPRRFCVKRANPDLFIRVNNLAHARLPHAQTWSGYGNLFFLDRPLFISVQLSRRATAQEIDAIASNVRREVAQGAVVISPFISPGEKAIAEMVMQQDYGDLILMKPDAFRPFYKPHGHYFDLCAQGRLLILSAFPDSKETTLTREKCLLMNGWCAAIARLA